MSESPPDKSFEGAVAHRGSRLAAFRSVPIAIVAGVAAGAAWLGLMEMSVRLVPGASPWSSTLVSALASLGPIVPGFVAGLVAARRGFTVGAVASLLDSILSSVYINFIDSRSVMDPARAAAIPAEVTYALAAVVVGGICGIAGAAVARERWNAF